MADRQFQCQWNSVSVSETTQCVERWSQPTGRLVVVQYCFAGWSLCRRGGRGEWDEWLVEEGWGVGGGEGGGGGGDLRHGGEEGEAEAASISGKLHSAFIYACSSIHVKCEVERIAAFFWQIMSRFSAATNCLSGIAIYQKMQCTPDEWFHYNNWWENIRNCRRFLQPPLLSPQCEAICAKLCNWVGNWYVGAQPDKFRSHDTFFRAGSYYTNPGIVACRWK